MKKILAILSLALISQTALASIQSDWRPAVLTHPVVTALQQLLNSKFAGSCVAPKAEDMQVGCTGAIPPVTEATLLNEPCFFKFKIACNGGSAEISGEEQVYILVNPGHPTHAADPVIVIQDVEIR